MLLRDFRRNWKLTKVSGNPRAVTRIGGARRVRRRMLDLSCRLAWIDRLGLAIARANLSTWLASHHPDACRVVLMHAMSSAGCLLISDSGKGSPFGPCRCPSSLPNVTPPLGCRAQSRMPKPSDLFPGPVARTSLALDSQPAVPPLPVLATAPSQRAGSIGEEHACRLMPCARPGADQSVKTQRRKKYSAAHPPRVTIRPIGVNIIETSSSIAPITILLRRAGAKLGCATVLYLLYR
jgi:hypothetical protein